MGIATLSQPVGDTINFRSKVTGLTLSTTSQKIGVAMNLRRNGSNVPGPSIGSSWQISGVPWTGAVITVGIGRSYSTINDAIAATTGDILILVYNGSYTDTELDSATRKFYIKAAETSVIITVLLNTSHYDIIVEGVDITFLGGGDATSQFIFNRCTIRGDWNNYCDNTVSLINCRHYGTLPSRVVTYDNYGKTIHRTIVNHFLDVVAGTIPDGYAEADYVFAYNYNEITIAEHGSINGSSWVTINFGELKTLTRVDLYVYSGEYGCAFYIQYSLDGTTWVTPPDVFWTYNGRYTKQDLVAPITFQFMRMIVPYGSSHADFTIRGQYAYETAGVIGYGPTYGSDLITPGLGFTVSQPIKEIINLRRTISTS